MNICNLFSWLNANSGAFVAVLTAIYVLATILIFLANFKVIREMRLSREQLLRPLLVMSFESRRGGLMCLVLRNLGGSTANNLRVELSGDSINYLPKDQERFKNLKSASLTIVPKQEIIFPCGGPQYWEKLSKANIEGDLFYNDTFNKTNKEHFSIDIESFGGTLIHGTEMDELTTTLKRSLGELKDAIQSLKEDHEVEFKQGLTDSR